LVPLRGRARAVVAAAAVAAVAVGLGARSCSAGPSDTPPRPPEAVESPVPAASRPGVGRGSTGGVDFTMESRRASAPSGAGLAVVALRFGDQDKGYGLLRRCEGQGCEHALVATLDGGLSWITRQVPATASPLELVVPAPTTVLLRDGDAGWYVSTNAGRSFARRPPSPAPPELARPGYRVGCVDSPARPDCPTALFADGAGGARPVPSQPPLPGRLVDAEGSGPRVWAVGVEAGRVAAAVSADSGGTWRRVDPPAARDPLPAPELAVSADGAQAWLTAGAAVWRFDGAAWLPVPTAGDRPALREAVALGGDALGAASPEGFGLLVDGGTRWARPAPVVLARIGAMSLLGDGTLESVAGDGEVWLAVGEGPRRHWVHLTLWPAGNET
jgi:hypothetical protein